MIWNRIEDGLPDEKTEVLLHWLVPDMPPIYRLGSLLYKPFPEYAPIWKFELDCGDASATIFTNRDDEQPTHWAALTAPESNEPPAAPTSSDQAARKPHTSVAEVGAATGERP